MISAAVSPLRTTAGECAPIPPVFGPLVTVERLLVVLGRCERQRLLPIGDHHERDFLAGEELLDEDARRRGSELLLVEDHAEILVRLAGRADDDHAFPGGQAVDFEDGGIAHLLERGLRLIDRAAGRRVRGGDGVLPHELLREDLRPFQLRREPGRPEDLEAALLKLVDDSESERKLGADHGEVHLQLFGEIGQLDDVCHADHRHTVGNARDSGISRCRVELPGRAATA